MFASTSPGNAAIVDRLITTLSAAPIGHVISYSDLRSVAPGWNKGRNFWLLTAAKAKVEKDLGCVFAIVRGAGIKRLEGHDIPGVGLAALGKIRRGARREKKRIDRVNINSLSDTDQKKVIGTSAMLGAIAVIADGRKAGAVADVADRAKPVPPANVLALFRQPAN